MTYDALEVFEWDGEWLAIWVFIDDYDEFETYTSIMDEQQLARLSGEVNLRDYPG